VTGITAFDHLQTSIAQLSVTDGPIQGSPNGMWQRVELWEISPNPDFEQLKVFLPENTILSEVVIDTISVPEPSSFVLAALGLVGLATWSWRRKR
jgi:hypothetical protein